MAWIICIIAIALAVIIYKIGTYTVLDDLKLSIILVLIIIGIVMALLGLLSILK